VDKGDDSDDVCATRKIAPHDRSGTLCSELKGDNARLKGRDYKYFTIRPISWHSQNGQMRLEFNLDQKSWAGTRSKARPVPRQPEGEELRPGGHEREIQQTPSHIDRQTQTHANLGSRKGGEQRQVK